MPPLHINTIAINARNITAGTPITVVSIPIAKYLFPLVKLHTIPAIKPTGQTRKLASMNKSSPVSESPFAISMSIIEDIHIAAGARIRPTKNQPTLEPLPCSRRDTIPSAPPLLASSEETLPLRMVPPDSRLVVSPPHGFPSETEVISTDSGLPST